MPQLSRTFAERLIYPVAALTLAAVLLLPGAPSAQEEGDADSARSEIEEIVVTARKRAETTLEIPESISVLSGIDISRQNIKGLEEVGFQVPNMNLSTRLDGFPNVSIRGLGSFGNTQGVGFYLDDVQIFSDASSRFGDLDRIEILKGPQGVLFGGSNIGGAVKFVSSRPNSEEMSGRVKLLGGGQGMADGEVSLNVPLGENGWAMRLFGFSAEHDGYLKNPNSPRVNGLVNDNDRDIGETEESGVRVSLAGPLSDRLSAYASLRWNDFEGPNNTWIRELSQTSLRHPDKVDTSTNARHERDTVSAMLELTYELDGFDVTTVSSYTNTDSDRYTDLDQTQEWLLDLFRPEEMKVWTQELRFTSTGDGPLQWLGGVYYSSFDEKMDSDLVWWNTRALPDGNLTGPLGCVAGLPTCSGVWAGDTLTLAQEQEMFLTPFEKRKRDKSHLAAFANATYAFGDDWELGVGLRIDRWENESRQFGDVPLKADDDDVEILPRLSLSRWLGDDSMLYATLSRGFEPAGFNVTSDTPDLGFLPHFDGEDATSYEIGWKGRLLEGAMTASVAAFLVQYKDKQIETQVPATGAGLTELIANIGDSEQYGVEFETRWRVSDALTLAASAGWIEAEWDSGTSVFTGDGSVKDIGGDTPPVIPDFSWNVSADYQQPITDGLSFIAGVQVSHNGEYDGLRVADPIGVSVTNPDFTLVGAQIGLAGENWELTVNVENLLDEDYYTDVQTFPDFYFLDGDADEIITIGTLGQPRLATISLSYFF